MRLIAKVLLIAFGGLLLLGALLIFGANLYVQSTLSQARMESEMSRALHVPVKITSTKVSPWRGLTIEGITVAQPEGAAAGNFFKAKNLVVHFKFWPIFRRQFVIAEIVLSEPTIAWWQDKKGRWPLPRVKSEPPPPPAPAPLAQTTPAKPAAPESSPAPKITAAKKRGPKFEVRLENLRVAGGNLYFYDREGRPLASLESVNIIAPEPAENRVEGQAKIALATLPGPVALEQISAPFIYKQGRVLLPSLSAQLAGGELSGAFQADPTAEGSPFQASAKFAQVDLHALLAQCTQTTLDLQGHASGWMDLQGQLAHGETVAGNGQLIVTGGQLRNYPVLQMLGDALGIDELAVMNLQTAQADFRVVNKRIWIDSLVLQSQNLRVLIWGSIKIGGQMKLQAELTINRKISRQLPEFVAQNFQPVPGTDQSSVRFNITGKYDKPRPDLLDKVLGKSLEKKASKAIDFLRGFMGGGDKKIPPPEPVPEPKTGP